MLLGNLNIKEIEKRTGVEFPNELVEYMEPRRQQDASNIKDGKWHCFDMPFTLVCGDTKTATVIHNHLKEFGPDFKAPLGISVQS
jgi:hypothetical protein